MQVTDEMIEAAMAVPVVSGRENYVRRCLTAALSALVEEKPVAWYIERDDERLITDNDIIRDRWIAACREVIPLYASPVRSALAPAPGGEDVVRSLTRPIVGIEHRTASEVFDIMADRIRIALSRNPSDAQTVGDGSTSDAKGGQP